MRPRPPVWAGLVALPLERQVATIALDGAASRARMRSRQEQGPLVNDLQYPDAVMGELRAWFEGRGLPFNARAVERGLATAFYASLKREEDRPLSFALALVGATAPPGLETLDLWHAYVFAEPKELTPNNVAKLAATLNYEQASIGVLPDSEDPSIWGVLHHGASMARYARSEGAGEKVGPPFLGLVCRKPGEIIVEYGRGRILTFRSGRIVPQGARVLDDPGPVGAALRERFARAELGAPEGLYLATLAAVLRAIEASGHGGAVVVLPDEDLEHLDVAKYGCSSPFPELESRVRSLGRIGGQRGELFEASLGAGSDSPVWMRLQNATTDRSRAKRAWLDALEFVGDLAGGDGVVVLGPTLRVVAFGATITAPPCGEVCQAADSTAEGLSPLDPKGRGHRHGSALNFAAARPGAIVFVASQDGGISCATQVGEHTVFWPEVLLDNVPLAEAR